MRYNFHSRSCPLYGANLPQMRPVIDSMRLSDYAEQNGDPALMPAKRAWVIETRRQLGEDFPMLTAVGVRMKATPELVREGVRMAVEAGVGGHFARALRRGEPTDPARGAGRPRRNRGCWHEAAPRHCPADDRVAAGACRRGRSFPRSGPAAGRGVDPRQGNLAADAALRRRPARAEHARGDRALCVSVGGNRPGLRARFRSLGCHSPDSRHPAGGPRHAHEQLLNDVRLQLDNGFLPGSVWMPGSYHAKRHDNQPWFKPRRAKPPAGPGWSRPRIT
ncbi:MAG: hypothetical protein WDM96_05050 [Lacunisphaera sp.]